MKTKTIILIIVLLWGCGNQKQQFEISDKVWSQASAAFAELKTALDNENGKTWNHSLQGPLMLVNRDTRTIIANEGDEMGELIQREQLFVGKLPERINIANTAFDWNGKRWTMVALPLPDSKSDRLSLLIHESFHSIQPAIGFNDLAEIQSKHLDTKEGRVYLKLELEALKASLSEENAEMHLKNALLFRQFRYQIFPDAKIAENTLEINEGLAEYTGSILSQKSDSELKSHYANQIERLYSMPSFVRSFAYFTIPVYGYFMHKTDNDWNLELNNKTNLTDFISRFWGVETMALNEDEILELGKQYRLKSIQEDEGKREAILERLKDKYRKAFLSDSVLIIGLENMNIGFNPSNVMTLDTHGTVYPNMRITDNWGILTVDSGGALMSPDWKKVTLSKPIDIKDTIILGQGWELKPGKLWNLVLKDNKYILTKK
jgi:hypothetical protein